jgi:hypothetical protein
MTNKIEFEDKFENVSRLPMLWNPNQLKQHLTDRINRSASFSPYVILCGDHRTPLYRVTKSKKKMMILKIFPLSRNSCE